jgi:hypothetical protein
MLLPISGRLPRSDDTRLYRGLPSITHAHHPVRASRLVLTSPHPLCAEENVFAESERYQILTLKSGRSSADPLFFAQH